MKRTKLSIPILAVSLLFLSACGTLRTRAANEYPNATVAYSADAFQYKAAGDALFAAKDRLTDSQKAQFTLFQEEVRAADNVVYTLLQAWKATGRKPADYDDRSAALKAAQSKVITLSVEAVR